MNQAERHKVFVSFHHEDEYYKNEFTTMMDGNIVDRSVGDGDIDDTIKTDTIRQRIRDDFIRDASVTVVLIGPCTWQRKHVDWEIGSSLRDTKRNARCGLLGILLPNHPCLNRSPNLRLVPPRLADNCEGDDPFARMYSLPGISGIYGSEIVRDWIHQAFLRRKGIPPNNGRRQFAKNRTGDCRLGWPD